MKGLTFADLMALDYWQDKGKSNSEIATMLGMSTFHLDNATIPTEFRWAVEHIVRKNKIKQ